MIIVSDFADTVPAALRSHGRLALGFRAADGATRLHDRGEGGCLRVRVPRRIAGEGLEAVIVNTSGGLCGGDTLTQDIVWGAGAQATITTQAAEKVYRARGGDTRIDTRLTVGEGAAAAWLPQETILFDGARLRRETTIELAADARLVWAESLVFGRTARGEAMDGGTLRDALRIRRAGGLIHADVLDLGEAPAARLAVPALGDGARASGMILVAGPDVMAQRDAVRAGLAQSGALAGASAWNGLLAVRLLARDPAAVRAGMNAALRVVLGVAALPRVWRC